MANPTIPCASLYVGDLHPDVTEAILYDKFQTHGNVLSIRVCRDLVTRKSLGYAYVNYQASSEAKSAMDNLNFEDIHGRPCRIMWSQRDPAARRSGVGNIFIKNLDPSITVKEINDTFANFGEISSCKVQSDENGLSKGFAFVNFNIEADAEKAIQAINGKMIRDKIVYVAKFIPRTQRNAHNKDFTNCYIKNFGSHLLDKSLRELFEQYGEIVSAKVMVDKEGNSKGFGFVSYKEHEDALKAVNTLNGKVIEDKTIYVGRAMKKAERQRELRARYEKTRQERLQQHKSGVNLYIKNLGNDINDERLKNEFAVFGNITSAKVMLNKENNTSKGFGFVCFSAPDEATRAVSEMNGKIVEGKPLYVALAQKKEDRVAHLRSQFQQRNVHQPQPAVFNPSMMNFMMNPNAQRPFMARPANILQANARWPQNIPYNIPRNIGMPANQNIMMAAGMPQNQQRRNVMVDPILSQNRNARPITGNVQLNQPSFLEKPKTEKTSHLECGTHLSYGLSAMQGWRIDMEDAHTAILSLQPPFKSWAYFGIYDGHAGSSVSEICSKQLLPSILNTPEFKKLELDEFGNPIDIEQVKKGIRNGFLDLDKSIGQSKEVETGEDKSGSTVVSVFITPKYVIFANCGDSRGVLIRNNAVHFFTEDHKPMNPGERDRIMKAGGTVMIQRINGSLAVSRSLGDFDYKKVESKGPTEQLVSPDPEITVIEKVNNEDQLLVLACDGVWDVMTNDELGEFIIHRCQRVADLSKIAEEVIDNCLYKGSRDNMSLVIISTKNAPHFDQELASKDIKLNDLIKTKVQEYVNTEGNELEINSLLMWLQSAELTDLPPGGLTAKRFIIDPLFEDLCRDKQKPQNNSSESNHTLSVLSLLTGSGADSAYSSWPRNHEAPDNNESSSSKPKTL